jgi:hypothetical protein
MVLAAKALGQLAAASSDLDPMESVMVATVMEIAAVHPRAAMSNRELDA